MRKCISLRTSLLGFAAVIFAACMPLAHATTITNGTFNFTLTNGSLAPTGSFAWNDTTNTWNSFTVTWDGAVFDFAPQFVSLADLPTSGSWCAADPFVHGPNPGGLFCDGALFALPGAVTLPEQGHRIFGHLSASADGSYTVTETGNGVTAVPEPGSLGMLLLGLGLIGTLVFLRRRKLLLA